MRNYGQARLPYRVAEFFASGKGAGRYVSMAEMERVFRAERNSIAKAIRIIGEAGFEVKNFREDGDSLYVIKWQREGEWRDAVKR